MRLAAAALDATALLFYADRAGFLKRAGLAADVQAMSSGGAVTIAVVGGAVDVGCGEMVALILAYHRGIPLTLVAPGSLYTAKAPVGMLFARNDLTVTSGADFNGKTIAVVGVGGFAQFGTQLWIDTNRGDSKTVKFVPLAAPQIAVALADGRVDGAYVPEPFVAVVRKSARVVTDSMSAIASQFYAGAHFALMPYANGHVDDVRRLRGALSAAATWTNANQEQTALILEQISGLSPAMLADAKRAVWAPAFDPALLQPIIDLTARYGNVPTIPANQLIYRA